MTAKEAVNWIINIMADIGKSEHRALWHYEQALMEIREMLETSAQPEIIKCEDCRHNGSFDTDCPIDWNGKEYCNFAERREE